LLPPPPQATRAADSNATEIQWPINFNFMSSPGNGQLGLDCLFFGFQPYATGEATQ
jgi:hypothetical protein